jgi:hypothetical protein
MGILLDGIFASEQVDSSGEILLVEGCDISTLDKDGVANWEHNNDDAEDIVGKVTYAKKILKESDCENERQLRFFKHAKGPYIYGIVELLDEEEHPGASAIAAMLKYSKKRKEPLVVGFSIEGSTLEKDGNLLKRTLARRVAITIKPANKNCISDVLELSDQMQKAFGSDSFKPLAKGQEVELEPIHKQKSDNPLQDFIEAAAVIRALSKTLTAGVPSGAPGTNTGGAALQAETTSKKKKPLTRFEIFSAANRLKAAIRDRKPGQSPEEAIKAELPNLGEKFMDHFEDIMSELSLKKSMRDIVTSNDVFSHIPHSKDQKILVAGIRAKKLQPLEMEKTVNSSGQSVLVMKGLQDETHYNSTAERAVIYFNMADRFFGLGENTVKTAGFYHPHDGSMYFVEKIMPMSAYNGHSPDHIEEYDAKIIQEAQSGLLHKIIIMDYIMGHGNRDATNLLVNGANLVLVDNYDCFTEPVYPEILHILDPQHKVVDISTLQWLESLSEKDLARYLMVNGAAKQDIQGCVQRLVDAKQKISTYMVIDSLFDYLEFEEKI